VVRADLLDQVLQRLNLIAHREQVISNILMLNVPLDTIEVSMLAIALVGVLMQKTGLPISVATKAVQLLKAYPQALDLHIIDGRVMAVPTSPTAMTFLRLTDFTPVENIAEEVNGVIVTEFSCQQIVSVITRLLVPAVGP
jgi:hypothetical protein